MDLAREDDRRFGAIVDQGTRKESKICETRGKYMTHKFTVTGGLTENISRLAASAPDVAVGTVASPRVVAG